MRRGLTIVSFMAFFITLAACAPLHPGPELTKDGVRFTFSSPQAKSVAISGSFNAWSRSRDRLSGPDEHGTWSILIPLSEGRYEYLFLIDGHTWQVDPSVPAVDDGFGGKNSVIVIGEHSL